MKIQCILFVIAIVSSHALGFRIRRQANEQDTDLEDRYGWDQRTWGQNQRQFSGQGQFTGQGQFSGQGQFPGQAQFPGLSLSPGQWLFPDQGQFPQVIPGQQQQQRTTSTTSTPSTITTSGNGAAIKRCQANCPVTAEYNPVCGSDNNTYDNPGRLECAQNCGLKITLLRKSRCPQTTPAPQ
uniref:Setae polypeptide n=1 Tax=Ochrogaster lunifer TaxID=319761 RepID=A0AA49ETB2_OCHLU|nr:setae polypeptide [Ochrogaster lunifer]